MNSKSNELEKIKEKIHTLNPTITDELLELLCEYVNYKDYEYFKNQLGYDNNFRNFIIELALAQISL